MALKNLHDTFIESIFSEKENAIGRPETVFPLLLSKKIESKKTNEGLK